MEKEDIFQACNNGDIDTIRKILESGVNIENLTKIGYNPIFYSVLTNNKYVLGEFLTQKLNINKKTKNGYSLLTFSFLVARKSISILLLENGVDIENDFETDMSFKICFLTKRFDLFEEVLKVPVQKHPGKN